MAFGVVLGLTNSGSNNSNSPELVLSKYSGEINKNGTITFTVITPSDGQLYASSNDTNIATVTVVNNNTVSVDGINYGNAIITVIQGAGTNYGVSSSKEFLCVVQDNMPIQIGNTLNETGWDAIADASTRGIGSAYWNIGDMKSITLNGGIGMLSLNNFETNVFILHFNYSMNGIAENNIIWGGFKDSSGEDIALVDSNYYQVSDNGTMYFNMIHWGYHIDLDLIGELENEEDWYNYHDIYGGWKGCDLRYDILGATSTPPSDYGKIHTTANVGYDATSATLTNPKANTLLAALPTNFRNSLRLWSRWIDAVGEYWREDESNYHGVDANIQETIDAVTLLAESEISGHFIIANEYEQNHQSQMEYYRLGNSRIKYKHNVSVFEDVEDRVWWWFASPSYDSGGFACCNSDGWCERQSYPHMSMAIAPAFKT